MLTAFLIVGAIVLFSVGIIFLSLNEFMKDSGRMFEQKTQLPRREE